MACKIVRTLAGSVKMPALGYGTWMAGDKELTDALECALEAGYRHIDTAHVYENEGVIGTVLQRWINAGKLKREDVFLVTKLPPSGNYPDGVQKYMKRSLDLLKVDYVDLFLIHVPFRFKDVEGDLHPFNADGEIDRIDEVDHVAVWKEMEKLKKEGKTRAIGISNFNKRQISRILDNCELKPSSLQIELHAYNQQKDLVDFCKENDIQITAFSPLGSPGLGKFMAKFGHNKEMPDVLGNPTVKKLSEKHNKSPAQILIRHLLQKGLTTIPKSTNPKRIKENLDVFDFELDANDMDEMNALDQGPNARILRFEGFKGIEKHPEYPF